MDASKACRVLYAILASESESISKASERSGRQYSSFVYFTALGLFRELYRDAWSEPRVSGPHFECTSSYQPITTERTGGRPLRFDHLVVRTDAGMFFMSRSSKHKYPLQGRIDCA